ncbi:hypothetical protein N5923_08865 [Erwiniaceae bacterium BAC15a-03b]|uniref:Antitoxin Xre/MbcA/ParS-like toxin-binding domain-containing protein n=1 Tax=Winslowiella arboricola TaxID=2978220 RepID=A0A9J6PH18_9GAMM|nr:hypothetical protein [Winslowiella arboricola]MCU5771728.1 hypothetical protein [Winslowiella arboricola]MCU5777601.1 hypothetical protein [Winslowiella arboricola]
MSSLEHYYAGDEKWKNCADFYAEDYLDDNARLLAKKLDGNLDLAVIIYGKIGLKEGLWWVEREVPALEGVKPVDCLKDPELLKRLRECVMRMP